MNPRYILFIHLVVNDIIQLTTSTLLFLLSYFFRINIFLCCIIVSFSILTTLNSPLNLAVMAVECYIAVCFPLRHLELCSVKKIYIVIACIWSFSMLSILPDIFFVMATNSTNTLFLSTIVCSIKQLLPNAVFIKKKEVVYILCLVGVWLVLLYTYIQIFTAAKSNRSLKQSDTKKARNMILLHAFQLLLSMLTFVYSMTQQTIIDTFPRHFVHVIFVWYVLVQIIPRGISPIVYGLRDSFFRKHLKKDLFSSCSSS